MPSPARDFLGTCLRFPFREAPGGLPEIEMVSGAECVNSVVRFLLKTSPGEIRWDPALGMDPETLRFDPTDFRSVQEARRLLATSLQESDPRIASASADLRPLPRERRMDVSVNYALISEQVPRNRVVLPEGAHEDILEDVADPLSAIVGYNDSGLMGISP